MIIQLLTKIIKENVLKTREKNKYIVSCGKKYDFKIICK